MTHDCTHWLGKLSNLNVARTADRGAAPHKPLMLLTIMDLIESGDVPDGWVKFDVRLVSRFRDYSQLHVPGISHGFNHPAVPPLRVHVENHSVIA